MIQLRNIRKTYGKHSVLNGINITVEKGDVIAILGPSGSGKTTLLRCINFLEHPNEGEITIGEVAVDCKHASKKDVLALRRKTAMVFQHYNLFKHKTVLQNVMEGLTVVQKMPAEEAREISLLMLAKVGLTHKADSYPSQLSGGQQQRVGIARALALNPEVILFDEPTSSLDPELVGEVLTVIQNIAQEGVTMIVVTHEMGFARDISNHIVFMEEGRIIEEGKPQDIFNAPKEERTKQFFKRFTNEWSYSI
ncbi:amino acid ABC transporter ATP-binding protein [Paenibacillus selenitireducens]|uniref:Amino acid ABC transporter ATP-binding protein n=1 Tax=Paenibacillus selenitireducens TaxID=1324314 RepID=A0A1T2XJR4_9BACL|nr:amino acid ABC transporter ATP-binding protein [Paenibacillus selenitireducens]OPA80120.1 amino acid ABC transporter ATP-binding protein [Paenibacillus selenitireducens]